MEFFKRAVLPVIVIVILLAALVYRISSCSPGGSSVTASPSVSPSTPAEEPTDTASPSDKGPAASPTAPYDDTEIGTIYQSRGFNIAEIRDAGDVTMVHYYKPTGVQGETLSRFDWFDRSTGDRRLVYGWAYTQAFEIKPDKTFTALTTGLAPATGTQLFPTIYRASVENTDGAILEKGGEEEYYAPLDKSVTLGTDYPAALTGIHFTGGFVSLGFDAPIGDEGSFYGHEASLPKMSVENTDGFCTITLYQTTPSDGIDPEAKENAYCSLDRISSDGTDTIIKLKLNQASVSRYNIRLERSPATALPYAVIAFTNVAVDYPPGW